MNLDGSTVLILWGYKAVTLPSVKWVPKSDGNWNGTDRGAGADIFKAQVVFKGPEAEMSTLETELNDNRKNFSLTCGTGEEIFGADIDYSSALDVTVIKYGKIKKTSFGAYSMPLTLRLFSPSYTGSASISDLRIKSFSYEAGSEFTLTKHITYDGTATYLDRATDPGIFKGRFLQTQSEMKAIRRYLLTTARTASVGFPSFGIAKPFGQRMGTGPFNCKIINWRDGGRPNFRNWDLDITFARVI